MRPNLDVVFGCKNHDMSKDNVRISSRSAIFERGVSGSVLSVDVSLAMTPSITKPMEDFCYGKCFEDVDIRRINLA